MCMKKQLWDYGLNLAPELMSSFSFSPNRDVILIYLSSETVARHLGGTCESPNVLLKNTDAHTSPPIN